MFPILPPIFFYYTGEKAIPLLVGIVRILPLWLKKKPFKCILSNLTVLDLLSTPYWKGLHSTPVIKAGKGNELMGMASQSAIIQWLVDSDPKALGPEVHLPLSQLKVGLLGNSNPISVQVDVSLIQVIDTMVSNQVSAVPILDSSGHLIGNLSTSDLAVVKEEDNLKYLNHPIHTYLSTFGLAHPITCKENDSLIEIMKKVSEKKIHRIYCVTEQQTLQSVITLTDILQAITNIATHSGQIE